MFASGGPIWRTETIEYNSSVVHTFVVQMLDERSREVYSGMKNNSIHGGNSVL